MSKLEELQEKYREAVYQRTKADEQTRGYNKPGWDWSRGIARDNLRDRKREAQEALEALRLELYK